MTDEPASLAEPAAPDPAAYDARDLTRGQSTTVIRLDGQIYTLRITRNGKLILTK